MYWNTVHPTLRGILQSIMEDRLFDPFRLVGGTALSLQWGHRMSVDIDMFTDADYGSIDFSRIWEGLNGHYAYVDVHNPSMANIGMSLFVGHHRDDAIKLDMYHTDAFIRPHLYRDGIRMADAADIIAMKLDIIGRGGWKGGRKKDFWDIHQAFDNYPLVEMLGFYQERYPYGHTPDELIRGLNDFTQADEDFEPLCLLGKHWDLIRHDFVRWVDLFSRPDV